MRHFFLLILLFAVFLVAGLVYQVPYKKVTEKITEEKTKVIFEPKIVEKEVDMPGKSVTIRGIGVYNDTGSGGEIIDIHLRVKDGEGKTYFDVTDHFFTEDIQESMQSIRDNVERWTGTNMKFKDIFVQVDLKTPYVGGTSASAFMGVGLVALIENKKIRQDALMTGTLDATGYILPVGNIKQKVDIVQDSGFNVLVVPQYNCQDAIKEALGSSVEIICVSTFSDAVDNMLS